MKLTNILIILLLVANLMVSLAVYGRLISTDNKTAEVAAAIPNLKADVEQRFGLLSYDNQGIRDAILSACGVGENAR